MVGLCDRLGGGNRGGKDVVRGIGGEYFQSGNGGPSVSDGLLRDADDDVGNFRSAASRLRNSRKEAGHSSGCGNAAYAVGAGQAGDQGCAQSGQAGGGKGNHRHGKHEDRLDVYRYYQRLRRRNIRVVMADWRIISFVARYDHVSYSAGGIRFGAGVGDGGVADQFGGLSESAGAYMRGRIDDVCVLHRDGSSIMSIIEKRAGNLRDRRRRLDHADSLNRGVSGRGDVRGTVDEFDDALVGSLDKADAVGRTREKRMKPEG